MKSFQLPDEFVKPVRMEHREHAPKSLIDVVNTVDIMALQTQTALTFIQQDFVDKTERTFTNYEMYNALEQVMLGILDIQSVINGFWASLKIAIQAA